MTIPASGALLTPESVYSTTSTELAACLVTLGFELLDGGAYRLIGDGIAAPGGAVTWKFSSRSRDGRYELAQILARWDDADWLSRPDNTDPLAYIICANHNRRRLIDQVEKSCPLAVIQQGSRHALIRKDADHRLRGLVEQFLAGR